MAHYVEPGVARITSEAGLTKGGGGILAQGPEEATRRGSSTKFNV
jgi:hypothetical protein